MRRQGHRSCGDGPVSSRDARAALGQGLLSLRQGLLARSQGLLFLWLRDSRTAMERAREGPRKTAADVGSAAAAGLPARPACAGQSLQMWSWARALRQNQHLAPRAALTTRRPAPAPVRPGSQALGPGARCDNLGSDADLKHEQHLPRHFAGRAGRQCWCAKAERARRRCSVRGP